MRQPARIEAAESFVAQRRDCAAARKLGSRSGKRSAKCLFGRCVDGAHLCVHQAASP
jgi:hypothetical protein